MALCGSRVTPVAAWLKAISSITALSGTAWASNSPRIVASTASSRWNPPDCFSPAMSRDRLDASRPSASNSSRSKFEEIWMSMEGEVVGSTPRNS